MTQATIGCNARAICNSGAATSWDYYQFSLVGLKAFSLTRARFVYYSWAVSSSNIHLGRSAADAAIRDHLVYSRSCR